MALIIAHRGDSAHAPENTLESFDAAIQAGADWIELDVRFSSDGVAMVIHDAALDRTTSGRGRVRDFAASELARLDAGSWFAESFSGARLPRLDEVLDLLEPSSARLLLEVKPTVRADRGPAARMLDGLAGSKWNSRVTIESFDFGLLLHLRENLSHLSTAALFKRWRPDWMIRARQLAAQFVCPRRTWVTPRVVSRAHEAGLGVLVWTVDDPAEATRLQKWGVDGLITNFPARIDSLF